MPKYLTKKQKVKADKIIKLLKELSDDNVSFYLNSMPHLQIGFLKNAEDVDGYDNFFDFLNSEKGDMYYSPHIRLKLESYGA